MAAFTIKLKDVITATGGTVALNDDGVTIVTGGNIGLNYYKPYEAAHKSILDGKIIDHYFNREIGQETIQMFQLAMRRKMNEIMPYYNELYKTLTFEFDPMHTIDIHTVAVGKEIQNVKVEDNAESVTDHKSGSRTVQSELPQTMLAGNADYATSGVDATTTSDGTTVATSEKSSDSDTDNNTDTQVTGYQAYPSNLIAQYRDIILNIDGMILMELDTLFMQVWNHGDDYNPYPRSSWGYPFYF